MSKIPGKEMPALRANIENNEKLIVELQKNIKKLIKICNDTNKLVYQKETEIKES